MIHISDELCLDLEIKLPLKCFCYAAEILQFSRVLNCVVFFSEHCKATFLMMCGMLQIHANEILANVTLVLVAEVL